MLRSGMLRRAKWLAIVGCGLVLSVTLLEWSVDAMDVLRVGELADFRELEARSRPALRAGLGEPVLWRLESGPAWRAGGSGFTIDPGSDGRRGPDVVVPKPPGTYRIVAFGDGAVFGWGVDDELTAVRQLEALLRDTAPPDVTIEVVNAGHPFQTLHRVDDALDGLAGLQPDLFVVFDRALVTGLPADLRAIRDGTAAEAPWWAALTPTLRDVLVRASAGRAERSAAEDLADAPRVAWRLRKVAKRGTRVLLVESGTRSFQVPGEVEHCVVDLSAASGPVYDAPHTGFPSPLGHRRIAESLAEALRGTVPSRGD